MIKVNSSYSENPQFQYDDKEIEVDLNLINNFNFHYRNLNNRDYDVDFRIQNGYESQKILAIFFKNLENSVIDLYELQFFKELNQYANIYLNELIEWVGNDKSYENRNYKKTDLENNFFNNLHITGNIDKEKLDLILSSLKKSIFKLEEKVKIGKTDRENLTLSSYADLKVTIKTLNKYFSTIGVNQMISLYMGREYKVGGIALELSPANAAWWDKNNAGNILSKAAYAHIDESTIKPKAIIYLNDVDSSNGPTSCYPGLLEKLKITPIQEVIGRVIGNIGSSPNSVLRNYYNRESSYISSSKEFRRHFMRLPSQSRFNSHIGWDILPYSSLEDAFISTERRLTGRAGTFIVFDGGKILHKGGMVEFGQRLALQVIFEEASFRANLKKLLNSLILKIKKYK